MMCFPLQFGPLISTGMTVMPVLSKCCLTHFICKDLQVMSCFIISLLQILQIPGIVVGCYLQHVSKVDFSPLNSDYGRTIYLSVQTLQL